MTQSTEIDASMVDEDDAPLKKWMGDPQHVALLKRVGAEMLEIRQVAGLTQTQVAQLFDWNKAAISKIEKGRTDLGLHDYLLFMYTMREHVPTHPAIPLAEKLLGKPRSRLRVVK